MERMGWRRATTVGAIAGAFLLVLAIPSLAPGADASPVAPAGITTSGSQWAYGGWTWANSSLTFPNGTLAVTSFFGWHVIYTATNTSNTTTMLEIQRTAAAKLTARFCSPNCGNATVSANLSIAGWEKSTAFVNLTRNATVTMNGTSVAAWGILNESGTSRANLTESMDLATTAHGGHSASSYLSVAAQGDHMISFGTPLGVVPDHVAVGDDWSSTAPYTASGDWSAHGLFAHTGLLGGKTVLTLSPSGSFSGAGNLTLYGSDVGSFNLSNGVATQAIVIVVVGPYSVHEGLLLVPSTLDIFSTGIHPWDGYGVGMAAFHTDRADLRLVPGRAPQVDAAASGYAGTAAGITPVGPPTKVTPMVGTPGAQGEIQAQPESPAVAQQDSTCLVSTCPSGSSAPGGAGGLVGLVVVVGLLAALVVGTVGVIEYRQWMKRSRRSRDLVGPAYGEPTGSVPPGTTLTGPIRPADPTGNGVPPPPDSSTGPAPPRGPI